VVVVKVVVVVVEVMVVVVEVVVVVGMGVRARAVRARAQTDNCCHKPTSPKCCSCAIGHSYSLLIGSKMQTCILPAQHMPSLSL
jgi:hypothetical protein